MNISERLNSSRHPSLFTQMALTATEINWVLGKMPPGKMPLEKVLPENCPPEISTPGILPPGKLPTGKLPPLRPKKSIL